MAPRFVLDSFGVMALLQDEPGAAKMQELLEAGSKGECELYISVVNLGEVLYLLENRRGIDAAHEALAFIEQSPIRTAHVDRSLALLAARLKAATGIGYADCFAAALAQQLNAVLVTGDPDFQQVEDTVPVEWLPTLQPR